ncbi:unnamed protein product, partial [Mesorhabditis belari]|uniref:Protein Wnt n=2 Tax=Mesorhabditis belari TaxID=2138241 RepID=A0AAF3J3A2_9BILA
MGYSITIGEIDEPKCEILPTTMLNQSADHLSLSNQCSVLVFIGFLSIGAFAVNQYSPPSTSPQPPIRMLQGCPPALLHSRSFRHAQILCRTQPALVVAAYEGIKDALSQCEEKLRFHAWDCTKIGHPLLDPPLLKYAHRESALVWALSSTGAAWGIATACMQGWLPECACTPTAGEKAWEWSGCSYGVQYGLAASRRLFSRGAAYKDDDGVGRERRGGRDLPAGNPSKIAERHNLKAGRLAVKKSVLQSCKCHGVSGSCQQKTCWKRTADLETITGHLIDKYHRTRSVLPETKVKNADLLAFEQSPDHCAARTASRRVCGWRNETHSQGDCNSLCCGRGYNVTHEVIPYKCDCKFVWCCQLVCNECLQHRWTSTCL